MGNLDAVIGKGSTASYRAFAKSQGQTIPNAQQRATGKAQGNAKNPYATGGNLDSVLGQGPDSSYTQFLKQQQADSQQKQQQLAQQLLQKQQQSQAPKPSAPATKPPSGLLGGISTYAKALITSPVGTIKDIASGQHIKAVDNGALIVDRAPQSYTAPIRKAQAGNLPPGVPGQLDHTVPLEIGGTNAKGNLKLIPKAQDQANNSVENYLGAQLKANAINAQQAQQLNNDYKAGKITAQDVYNKAQKGALPPLGLPPPTTAQNPNFVKGLTSGVAKAKAQEAPQYQDHTQSELSPGQLVIQTGQGLARILPTLGASLQQAITGKAPTLKPTNAVTKAIFGKQPGQTLQQGAETTTQAHPQGFHIPGTPITLTPKETGAAYAAGQLAQDLPVVGGLAKGAAKGIETGVAAAGKDVATNDLVQATKVKSLINAGVKPAPEAPPTGGLSQAVDNLQAQKGKLAELKAQHPANGPAIDKVIANADQKLTEVQKAQAKEPPLAVQTEPGIPATPRPPAEVLSDIKTSTSAIHQASDGKTPADFITANGSQFTPKSSTPKELLPLVENHAELQTEYAAAKTSPDTIHAQIKDLLSNDKSYDQSGNVTPEVAQQVNGLNKQLNGLGERVPAVAKPVSVKPIEPTVAETPPIKTSKLAQGVEANAIKKGLTQGFEDKPEYAQVNVDQQTKAASDLVKSDPERATRIAMGHERPPEGLLPESAFIAVEQAATKSGNVDLIRRLATESHLTSEATGMGQRIRMLGERENTSPVSAIKQVQKARADAFKAKTGKAADKAVSDEIKAIRAAKPKVTRMDWGQWVESIRC